MWRASWIANELLRDWAAGAIAKESGGVYQLHLGRVRVNWALRRVAVDSIYLATLAPVNARRPQALPDLHVALYACTISGVHFITLARSAGLIAKSFGCRSGNIVVAIPRNTGTDEPDEPSEPAQRKAFLVFQRSVQLPSYAPRVRIARVVFPRMALELRLPRTARGAIRLQLELLQWSMGDLAIDPTDPTAAARPLFSKTIEIVANNFVTHPDRVTAVSVGLLRTSLTDSTLEIRDAGFTSGGGAAPRRYRSDLVGLTVGHVTAEGIDFGAFFAGRGIRARRIAVDSFQIDVTSDKRLPPSPVRSRHRTPQRWIADLDESLSVDSLLVRNGGVVYREHVTGREQPGVLTFTRVTAAATQVTHRVGRRRSAVPMTLTARAQLQYTGQIDVRAVIPLDAPRFDMTFRGTLGAMPAMSFNPFVVETRALQIASGQVAEVAFQLAVKNGVAVGTITPLFTDLAVSVTRSGSDGILGGGGLLGGAARGIASLAAKMTLRANNPVRATNAPLVGLIHHTFTPDETLIAFLWSGMRDGLLTVVKK